MTAALLALALARPPHPSDAELRAALDLLYDGSTDSALAHLAQLAEESPEDPLTAYACALAGVWKIEQRPDSSALDKDLHRRVDRAIALADARLVEDPEDLRALLARGAAHGVRSRLHFFRLQRREATRAALRMREDLARLRERDPESLEARFGLGLYDYYADVLPRLFRFLRFLAGIPGGNRERGLKLIEECRPSTLHGIEARAQLYEIHAFYERRPDPALEEIRELRRRYPGSPLWALKLAEHLRERVGLYPASAAVAREVLADVERGHPNYAPVVGAMARLALGEALVLDLRLPEARRLLLPLKDGVSEAAWIASRTRLLLGRGLELEGDRDAALVHYRAAAASEDREIRRRARAALERPLPASEVRAWHHVAEARRLREAGQRREAAAAFRKALAAWPGCHEAALRVAEEDLDGGRIDEARQALEDLAGEKSLEPPSLHPWAWLLLARARDLRGERGAALDAYKKVWEEPYGQEHLRREAAEGLERPFVPSGRAEARRRRLIHSR